MKTGELFGGGDGAEKGRAAAPLAERMPPDLVCRIRRSGVGPGPGQTAAGSDRTRQAAVGHFVGTTRHGQDDGGPPHRGGDERSLCRVQCGPVRDQGDQGGDGRGGVCSPPGGQRTIVFVDEIHRFNKAQQDAFLPRVEAGDIALIGATTENPSFEVNAALLSRSKVFVLEPLGTPQIVTILQRALEDNDRGLGGDRLEVVDGVLDVIAEYANGDARVALNTLELAAAIAGTDESGEPTAATIDLELLTRALQRRTLLYDKDGSEHFNLMSALHKSMRNSDPDASVYWLARMVEAGEDPLYIARRLVRFASEDIGNADPRALSLAISAKDAVHFVGMPEGNTALAQAVTYLAVAPKSNAVYVAYRDAARDAHNQVAEPVPLHLRNAPTRLMKDLDYGKGYEYAHDHAEGTTAMTCLPEALSDRQYYRPSNRGLEKAIAERIAAWRESRGRRVTHD